MALGFVAAILSSGELRHNLLQPMQQKKRSLVNFLVSKHKGGYYLKSLCDFCLPYFSSTTNELQVLA